MAFALVQPAEGKRFHRTILEEFYQVAFRKKVFQSLEELQRDVDEWITFYNRERPHTGRYCYGKTPMQTWRDSLHLAKAKQLDQYVEEKGTNQTQPDTLLRV